VDHLNTLLLHSFVLVLDFLFHRRISDHYLLSIRDFDFMLYAYKLLFFVIFFAGPFLLDTYFDSWFKCAVFFPASF